MAFPTKGVFTIRTNVVRFRSFQTRGRAELQLVARDLLTADMITRTPPFFCGTRNEPESAAMDVFVGAVGLSNGAWVAITNDSQTCAVVNSCGIDLRGFSTMPNTIHLIKTII